jgi:hypothetical protein
VPTAWRALREIAGGGDLRRRTVTAALRRARRHAWAHGIARHGGLPPVRVADRRLEGRDLQRPENAIMLEADLGAVADRAMWGYGVDPPRTHYLYISGRFRAW